MIELFWTFLIGTGVFMRAVTPPLHVRNKTPTFFLRRKTKKDIHHLHVGIFFLIATFLLFFITGISKSNIILGAIGLSLVADEIFLMPRISEREEEYFGNKGLILSIVAHVILGLIATIILVFYF